MAKDHKHSAAHLASVSLFVGRAGTSQAGSPLSRYSTKSEAAIGKLAVACGNGAVDFEVSEHPLDAIALFVERTVMLDPHSAN